MQLTVMEIESGESPFTGEVEDGDHFNQLMMMAVAHSRLITPVTVIIEDDDEMVATDPAERVRAVIAAELEACGRDADDALVEVLLLDLIKTFLQDLSMKMEEDL